jgi:hypothetical protein
VAKEQLNRAKVARSSVDKVTFVRRSEWVPNNDGSKMGWTTSASERRGVGAAPGRGATQRVPLDLDLQAARFIDKMTRLNVSVTRAARRGAALRQIALDHRVP